MVKDVCNRYLTHQQRRMESGEITAQWYEDCRRSATDFASFIGAHRPAAELHPVDFDRYRQKLRRRGLANGRKALGTYALDRSVTVVKAAFAYAYEMEVIDRPVRFGRDFRRSSAWRSGAPKPPQSIKTVDNASQSKTSGKRSGPPATLFAQ